MLRRDFLRFVLTGGLTAPLAGCALSRPLQVGIHPWIGYESFFLARDFGWLPPEVVLHVGKSASESLQGLAEARLDAAALTLDEVLKARGAGIPLVIVLVFDVSAGADMVLAREGIASLDRLAGHRLAVERSALGALMLTEVLKAAGLREQALIVVDMPVDQQPAAWQAGRIDAAITYEPTASRLQALGARRLFDSRSLPDTIFDVLAVRADRLEARQGALREALAAHFRALAHLRTNREDALYRIAAHQGVGPDAVARALGGVVLPGLAANRGYLQPGSRLAAAAARLSRLMHERGLLKAEDSLTGLLDASHLPSGEVGP